MNRALLRFARANRGHLLPLLLAGVVVNMLALALPLFSMLVYDKAVGNALHATLWALALGMGLAMGLELCVRVARVLLIEHAGARWDVHLDERLMRGVLGAPLSQALPVGAVLTRYRDLAASREVLSAAFLLPVADLPFVLLFAAALVAVAGPLVLIPLAVGIVLLGLGALFSVLAQRRQRHANGAHGRKLTLLVDTLLARESLAQPAAAAVAQAGFKPAAVEGARAAAQARTWHQLTQQVTPVGMAATTVLMLVASVYRVEAQLLSVGGMISATMLSGRLLALLCGLAPVLGRWREFRQALADLRATVDLDADAIEPSWARPTGSDPALAVAGLRAEAVAYAYPGHERRVIDGVTLQARTGELIALVGHSGAGKSTLLRLLAGRLAPTAGRLIVAGDVVADEPARRQLARRVLLKPQEPAFLPGSVRQIVDPARAVGVGAGIDARADAEADARALRSLQAAGLGPAIERGDLGLNTAVGSQGEGLSGGQRQMLALARALHADTPVLLMDEPTLGLDSKAQETLIEHLVAHSRSHCVIVATHTAELIRRCQRVWVLDRGRLVADASPERLMNPAAPAGRAAAPAAHEVTP
jgi:ATP-binding cassette subfamily B protein/ATP-binding cassette subfamily C protein LapB